MVDNDCGVPPYFIGLLYSYILSPSVFQSAEINMKKYIKSCLNIVTVVQYNSSLFTKYACLCILILPHVRYAATPPPPNTCQHNLCMYHWQMLMVPNSSGLRCQLFL